MALRALKAITALWEANRPHAWNSATQGTLWLSPNPAEGQHWGQLLGSSRRGVNKVALNGGLKW